MDPKPRPLHVELQTSADWNQELWDRILPIYEASFPKHIRKPERIVRNMLQNMNAFLHIGISEGQPCSMALTGLSADQRLLIVDYLAVSPSLREHGIGKKTVAALADWAREHYGINGLLLEAEIDDSEEGRNRLRFWQRCGFESTDYIHSYVWVPEKYRAMLLDLQNENERTIRPLGRDGKKLFEHIETFHELSFKGSKK